MSIAEKLTTVAENVPKVYEAGQKAEYDRFWDIFQENGKRTNYTSAFCYGGWTDDTYNPKYTIRPTSCNQMFIGAAYLTDTKVDIDLTHSGGTQKFTIFSSAKQLKTVRKLIVDESNNAHLEKAFMNCTSLENITFEGVVAGNIDLQWSTKLSKTSITNIINVLSTNTTGLTVTLSKTAVNNAFGIDVDDETTWGEGTEYYALRHSKDNWTISYV